MSTQPWHQDQARTLRVASAEGAFDAYLARPDERRRPVIVVLHEVFGVNEDLRATCGELAAAGFIALCPDLFWRQERHVELSVRSQPDWEQGIAIYQA